MRTSSSGRIAIALAVLTVLGVVSAGVTITLTRLLAQDPAATVTVDAPARLVLAPGSVTPVPLPAQGSLTITDSPTSVIADARGDEVRPIGSVAKTMTALEVLAARPLPVGQAGPAVTMTAADVALFADAVASQGSAVAVRAGERFTERQLLLSLLLPSANNIAETLARWVSGSRSTFVARLNRTATALGMTRTHFDDPSGISDATVSTTRDLVLLGRAALASPALAELVSQPRAELPDGTVIGNLDILLGTEPGWLGIKTGWTPRAGGCLLFAAMHSYAAGAAPVTVVGAVLGQPANSDGDPEHPELGGAMNAAQHAVSTAFANTVAVDLSALQPPVTGTVSTPWGSTTGVAVDRGAGGYAVVRLGAALTLTTSVTRLTMPVSAGRGIGRVSGTGANGIAITWTLRTTGALAEPSAWWKLVHG